MSRAKRFGSRSRSRKTKTNENINVDVNVNANAGTPTNDVMGMNIVGNEQVNNNSHNNSNDDPIPFQRLESPRPMSPPDVNARIINEHIKNDFNNDDDDESIDFTNDFNDEDEDHLEIEVETDDEQEPFASLEEGGSAGNEDGGENNLRPPSQNSIASVLKSSFHEAKQIINLCGVGVGGSASNGQYGDEPDQEGYEYGYGYGETAPDWGMGMGIPPLKFRSSTDPSVPPYQDSIPARTRTTSSSSLSSHLAKHKEHSFDHSGKPRSASTSTKHRQQHQQQNQQQQPQQQQQHLKQNQSTQKKNSSRQQQQQQQQPFPQSVYPNNHRHHNQLPNHNHPPLGNNNITIPLRHSQSVPFGAEPISHLAMRRSASTPAAFQIGRGRSAFGKVDGKSSSFSNRAPNTGASAGTGTSISMGTGSFSSPSTTLKNSSVTSVSMSDSKCQIRPKQQLSSTSTSVTAPVPTSTSAPTSTFNSISLQTPVKQRWLSKKNTNPNPQKPEVSHATTNAVVTDSAVAEEGNNANDFKDTLSVTSSDDVSSVTSSVYSSKSQIMTSKTQKKIKDYRRKKKKHQSSTKQQQKQQPLNESNESASSQQSHGQLLTSSLSSALTLEEDTDKDSSLNHSKESATSSKGQQNDKSLNDQFDQLHCKSDDVEGDKGNISFPSLESNVFESSNTNTCGNDTIDEVSPVNFACTFPEKIIPKPTSRKVESPIPSPSYHKIGDDDQPSPIYFNSNPPIPHPHSRRMTKTPASPIGRVATPPANPSRTRLILPHRSKGSMSPCSYDSASYSRATSRSGHSSNTLNQTLSTFGNVSCNRSVTSSVAEADREVRDLNRGELRRREGVDLDGSMSIQSSDTTSTNAYLALTSSPAQLRDGANIHHDRFFGCNNSIGPANSQSSNASSVGWNHGHQHFSPGMNGRNLTSRNVKSPITVSSNSIATVSTGEDPPRFVSCSPKVVPVNSNRGFMPPRSDHSDSSIGYSKLGSSESKSKSRSSSSRSSSSKSSKSKSSSRSKKKDKSRYIKIGSAKIADHSNTRSSTPSPCNSFMSSPVKTPFTPPSQFDYQYEPVDVPKPRVHRHLPAGNMVAGSKMVLISPCENDRRIAPLPLPVAQSLWSSNNRDQRAFAFQRTTISQTVTPEKAFDENSI